MKFWIIASVLALLGTGSISQVQAHGAEDLMNSDTLGSQVAYVEKTIGPAWKIEGNDRLYKIGPCVVTLTTNKGKIIAVGMDVNAKCNPNLGDFAGNSNSPKAYPQTFGSEYASGGIIEYGADCLEMCGNAYDPKLYMIMRGYHANNFIDIFFEALQVNTLTITAAQKWAETLKGQHNEDYVSDTKFNCDTSKDEAATKILAAAQITHVTIGHNLDPTGCAAKTK
jgi:hypothetical protein